MKGSFYLFFNLSIGKTRDYPVFSKKIDGGIITLKFFILQNSFIKNLDVTDYPLDNENDHLASDLLELTYFSWTLADLNLS